MVHLQWSSRRSNSNPTVGALSRPSLKIPPAIAIAVGLEIGLIVLAQVCSINSPDDMLEVILWLCVRAAVKFFEAPTALCGYKCYGVTMLSVAPWSYVWRSARGGLPMLQYGLQAVRHKCGSLKIDIHGLRKGVGRFCFAPNIMLTFWRIIAGLYDGVARSYAHP